LCVGALIDNRSHLKTPRDFAKAPGPRRFTRSGERSGSASCAATAAPFPRLCHGTLNLQFGTNL